MSDCEVLHAHCALFVCWRAGPLEWSQKAEKDFLLGGSACCALTRLVSSSMAAELLS